ncbi:hypothetical protein JOD29_003993 [Lysinibacillus composti]|nr:hypothetical protein [Lysinibacillus composti]
MSIVNLFHRGDEEGNRVLLLCKPLSSGLCRRINFTLLLQFHFLRFRSVKRGTKLIGAFQLDLNSNPNSLDFSLAGAY